MGAIQDMALECFGYGRWDAPYRFIGLEEGMSGILEDRIRVFGRQNKEGLCDCRRFHLGIGDNSHHGELSDVQGTWRVIMLILLTYLGKSVSEAELLAYQRERLGSENGETALLELWGLPAKSLGVGAQQKRKYFSAESEKAIYDQRQVKFLEKMRQYRPELVVMYGTTEKKKFWKFAGQEMDDWSVIRRGSTILTLTPHAKSWGNFPDSRWIQHANELLRWKATPPVLP